MNCDLRGSVQRGGLTPDTTHIIESRAYDQIQTMAATDTTQTASEPVTQQSFEDAVQELEAIIQRMSDGNQSLETSIAEFERGVGIVRACQKMLKDAEQRVELLTKSDTGELEPQPFKSEQVE